jgi:DNA-binding PadR family transcriptional regulator
MPTPDPRTHLPLPLHDFHILLSVFESPRHGYAIIQDIDTRTNGDTRLGTSTLYAALKRLGRDGLIGEVHRPTDEPSGDERRRYFRATTLGRAVAREEARRIERLHELASEARLIGTAAQSQGRR